MSFRLRMERSAQKRDSNIVLALDLETESPETLLSRSIKILKAASPYICALKLNHHLILPLGLFGGVQKILRLAQDHDLLTIMDCKINDVGNTNRIIAHNYYKAGFDAVIANPFVGWEEGLQPVFEAARQMKKGIILLCYMSHKAAWEGYGQTTQENEKPTPQYVTFARKALEWGADGVVVGATYPEKIREVHRILTGSHVPIYSPGVGVQGGDVQSAMKAGARYLIVGRTIVNATNPADASMRVWDAAKMKK